ncbi:transglycosylase SLT domain-containing protein [Rhizobium oryzicola]|uniref:Transglycosylase SLT domain-containing protein n=1 Tax=Rhizobium oryzicola TaxID=1232668 RepID=A0ABT8T3N8_9HYPH|nr:transglycosylase SLT domain-containing protein [Rhizobium oryzicola]MDO1584512.1 transglycosylase SLT domain-containing protein [Rhizobium oryzicola]
MASTDASKHTQPTQVATAAAGPTIEAANQLASTQAAGKTGRIVAGAGTPVVATAPAQVGPVAVPAGMTTTVAEKGDRIHVVALPTGRSALTAQNDAVIASLAAKQQQTQPLGLANAAQPTPGLQAINVATANQAMLKPTLDAVGAPAPISKPGQPQQMITAMPQIQAFPAEVTASYTAIPTPRPKTAQSPAPTSSMLAYAGSTQPVTALSNDFFPPAPGAPIPETAQVSTPELNKLIKRYSGMYGVPEALVHRVVHRESKYNPRAYNKRGFFGLMQIKYSTARAMGYQGTPQGLLDPETNLKYAIKYLRGAWLVAENDTNNAISLYARGYYYDAKRKDMLQQISDH